MNPLNGIKSADTASLWQNVPKQVLRNKVFCHLDSRDLARLWGSCRATREVMNSYFEWYCKEAKLTESKQESVTWKQHFEHFKGRNLVETYRNNQFVHMPLRIEQPREKHLEFIYKDVSLVGDKVYTWRNPHFSWQLPNIHTIESYGCSSRTKKAEGAGFIVNDKMLKKDVINGNSQGSYTLLDLKTNKEIIKINRGYIHFSTQYCDEKHLWLINSYNEGTYVDIISLTTPNAVVTLSSNREHSSEPANLVRSFKATCEKSACGYNTLVCFGKDVFSVFVMSDKNQLVKTKEVDWLGKGGCEYLRLVDENTIVFALHSRECIVKLDLESGVSQRWYNPGTKYLNSNRLSDNAINSLTVVGDLIVCGMPDDSINVWSTWSTKPLFSMKVNDKRGHCSNVTKVLATEDKIIALRQDQVDIFEAPTEVGAQPPLRRYSNAKTVALGLALILEVGVVALGIIALLGALHHAWGSVGVFLGQAGVVGSSVWVSAATILFIATCVALARAKKQRTAN